MAQYKILIADGDPDIIQYLSGTLKANGFDTLNTSSGVDALKIYKKDSPDLVVTDLSLTEIDGMQLLEELKDYDPTVKVIITTENTDKDIIARAFRTGALDILEKPLEPEYLISKIRDLLAREDHALEGNLQMMSLASIIQINCEERNQAQLSLNHMGKDATIFFQDGEMIHAEVGGLIGEDAIYSLLRWEEGSFQVKIGTAPRSITINKPWSGLLLEGMRRIDESTAGWSSEWDEPFSPPEEKSGSPLQERIIKAISNISDVETALIYADDGSVRAQEKSKDPEGDLKLGTLLQNKADLIGGFLESGKLERIVLTGSENRIYWQHQKDDRILLRLSKKSSVETVYESVETIYKRYQSA